MDRHAMRRPARAFAAFCVGVVLGGGWAVAEAQTEFKWPASNKVLVRDSTGTARLISLPTGTGVSPTGTGGAVLNGAARLGVGGSQAALTLARTITPQNVARGVLGLARVIGPLALAGIAIEGVVRWVENPDGPGGQWVKSEEQWDHVLPEGWQVPYCGAPGYPTGSLHFQYWMKNGIPTVTPKCLSPTGGTLVNYGDYPATREQVDVPATDDDLVISFQQGLINRADLADDVVSNALGRGVDADAFNPGPHVINGPSSVNGGSQTSTTVGPAGTTTTTTNTTYNISYTTNTINVTSSVVTTTTNPDGSTETTTEETEAGEGDGEEPPTDEEKPDFCEVNPTASACEELGDPEDEELEQEERDLSFDQELSDAGSCPAPESFTVQGKGYAMSWQPVCDFASGIRPVVLALSWLSAGAFVFAVGSRSA